MVYIQTMENLVKTPQCFQSDFLVNEREIQLKCQTLFKIIQPLSHI